MTQQNNLNRPPIHRPTPQAERIERLVDHLRKKYAIPLDAIRLVSAPLRISPLGAHIDHQLGHVTGLTIDRALLLAFAPSSDGSVTVESMNFSPPASFRLDDIPASQKDDWGNYVRGAALGLQQTHHIQKGIIGLIDGEMPIGGLSSSAATTLAYLLALETVNNLSLSREENVSLVRYAENRYIGINNGILDQTTILYSLPNHLTYIDCKSFAVKPIATPLKANHYTILSVFCGRSRILSGTAYNNRVAECQQAARLLLEFAHQPAQDGARLGDVDPAIFEAEGDRLPEIPRKRATHYFGEYERVSRGLAAWQAGKLEELGQLMNESGQSSIKFYESGSPQLITLYEILSQTPGVYGTRFSGAGFGGSCIALIDPIAAESVAEAVHRRYPAAHPAEAEAYSIHFCHSGGPARLITEGVGSRE
jgi:galactokinase/galacturonokinase